MQSFTTIMLLFVEKGYFNCQLWFFVTVNKTSRQRPQSHCCNWHSRAVNTIKINQIYNVSFAQKTNFGVL